MVSFLLVSIAGIYLLGGMIYFSIRRSGYNQLKHTISELGEFGSPLEKPVSLKLFLPVGALLLAAAGFGYYSHPLSSTHILVALCVSVGYIVAAFFPCDPGSPMTGTSRQQVHNLGGLIEYAGGAYFMLQSGIELIRQGGTFVFGVAIFISFITPWRGLIQRIGEVLLFTAMIYSVLIT